MRCLPAVDRCFRPRRDFKLRIKAALGIRFPPKLRAGEKGPTTRTDGPSGERPSDRALTEGHEQHSFPHAGQTTQLLCQRLSARQIVGADTFEGSTPCICPPLLFTLPNAWAHAARASSALFSTAWNTHLNCAL